MNEPSKRSYQDFSYSKAQTTEQADLQQPFASSTSDILSDSSSQIMTHDDSSFTTTTTTTGVQDLDFPASLPRNSTPLEAGSTREKIFHTFYAKVVNQGNLAPYQEHMLFRVSDDFTHKKCRKKYSNSLFKMLKTSRLTTLLGSRLVLSYYLTSLLTSLGNIAVNMSLPLALKSFIHWFESDATETPKTFFQGFWRVILFSVAMLFEP